MMSSSGEMHESKINITQTTTIPMSFLHDRALDEGRVLSQQERFAVDLAHSALINADIIIVYLGGKAGRLGETIVATGLLEALLLALNYLAKNDIPLSIIIDASCAALFDERLYQHKYWLAISIASTTPSIDALVEQTGARNILVVDLHGKHDGMPFIQIDEDVQHKTTITTLSNLFRVGVRSYADRGPLRRYAAFIEELLGLPESTIDGQQAQPCILLAMEEEARDPLLARQFGLDEEAMCIVCFFQSVVAAKCYGLWDEVMMQICDYMARNFPHQKLDFLLACGPDEQLPVGIKQADLEEWFQDFTGVEQNARILIRPTPSLSDLAILTRHAAFVLSNDTGPGHLAGALGIPTIIPFLPGNIYSRKVWSSTLWHRGVTIEPSPYTYQQLEAAVLWGKTEYIDSITPEALTAEVLKSLPEVLKKV